MQIAPELPRRGEARGHVHAPQTLGDRRGQQCRLYALRERQLALDAQLVRPHLFIQPGVFDRARRLAGEQRQDLDVLFREGVELGAFQVEDADAAILQQHGDGELRPAVLHHRDVAWFDGNVGHQHRFLVQRRISDNAGAKLHRRQRQLIAVADRELHLQLAGRVVQQQDPERPVVNQPAREDGDAFEQLVEVQNRGDLLADLGEGLQGGGVLPLAVEQPRVLERHGHVRAELAEDCLVAVGELARLGAEEIERADDALLPPERHDEL